MDTTARLLTALLRAKAEDTALGLVISVGGYRNPLGGAVEERLKVRSEALAKGVVAHARRMGVGQCTGDLIPSAVDGGGSHHRLLEGLVTNLCNDCRVLWHATNSAGGTKKEARRRGADSDESSSSSSSSSSSVTSGSDSDDDTDEKKNKKDTAGSCESVMCPRHTAYFRGGGVVVTQSRHAAVTSVIGSRLFDRSSDAIQTASHVTVSEWESACRALRTVTDTFDVNAPAAALVTTTTAGSAKCRSLTHQAPSPTAKRNTYTVRTQGSAVVGVNSASSSTTHSPQLGDLSMRLEHLASTVGQAPPSSIEPLSLTRFAEALSGLCKQSSSTTAAADTKPVNPLYYPSTVVAFFAHRFVNDALVLSEYSSRASSDISVSKALGHAIRAKCHPPLCCKVPSKASSVEVGSTTISAAIEGSLLDLVLTVFGAFISYARRQLAMVAASEVKWNDILLAKAKEMAADTTEGGNGTEGTQQQHDDLPASMTADALHIWSMVDAIMSQLPLLYALPTLVGAVVAPVVAVAQKGGGQTSHWADAIDAHLAGVAPTLVLSALLTFFAPHNASTMGKAGRGEDDSCVNDLLAAFFGMLSGKPVADDCEVAVSVNNTRAVGSSAALRTIPADGAAQSLLTTMTNNFRDSARFVRQVLEAATSPTLQLSNRSADGKVKRTAGSTAVLEQHSKEEHQLFWNPNALGVLKRIDILLEHDPSGGQNGEDGMDNKKGGHHLASSEGLSSSPSPNSVPPTAKSIIDCSTAAHKVFVANNKVTASRDKCTQIRAALAEKLAEAEALLHELHDASTVATRAEGELVDAVAEASVVEIVGRELWNRSSAMAAMTKFAAAPPPPPQPSGGVSTSAKAKKPRHSFASKRQREE